MELEEVGRPYRTELLEYGGAMKSPQFLAINPMGKVPTLVHRDVVVTDAAAICAYLADAYPDAGLAPSALDPARGMYLRWLFFAAGPLEAAITNKSLGFYVPSGRESMAGYGRFCDVVDTLDGVLSAGDYLTRERFTAADLYLASQLGFGMLFGALDKRASFERYVGRHSSRPAAQRAAAIDDALMGGPITPSAT